MTSRRSTRLAAKALQEAILNPETTWSPSIASPIAKRRKVTPTSRSITSQASKPRAVIPSSSIEHNPTAGTLVLPESSRIISPSESRGPSPTIPSVIPAGESVIPLINPDTLLQDAVAHLISVDPKLKTMIDRNPCTVFSPESLREKVDPWVSLVSSIISQQVSGAAAKTIRNRFVKLFNPDSPEIPLGKAEGFPTPKQVLEKTVEELRPAGLSQRKAEYIRGLAEHFDSGAITALFLASAPYEEVVERLVACRGLGLWSIEMFATFALKRPDIFSTGDLGVQKGTAVYLGRKVSKLKSGKGKWKYLSEKEMEETSEPFKPYRSIFMWYMWKYADTDAGALTE